MKVVLVYKRVILPIHLQVNENIFRRLILKNKNVSLISLVACLNGKIRSLEEQMPSFNTDWCLQGNFKCDVKPSPLWQFKGVITIFQHQGELMLV